MNSGTDGGVCNIRIGMEYTFGYVKNDAGKLKIFAHHSSLPYSKK